MSREERGERREEIHEERGERRKERGEGRGDRMTPDLRFLIGVARGVLLCPHSGSWILSGFLDPLGGLG